MFDFVVNLVKQLAPYLALIAVGCVGYYVYKNYFATPQQSSQTILQNQQQSPLESPQSPHPLPHQPPQISGASAKYQKMLIQGIEVTDNCPECNAQLSHDEQTNIVCHTCKVMYGQKAT